LSSLQQRLVEVQTRIASACVKHQRKLDDVELIVITKNHPAQLVLDLIELGCSQFGENRDQEAKPKAALVADQTDLANWHFVGQLQSNKAKSVLGYARSIHSLDRDSLLDVLGKLELPVEVFIQLNLTADENRGGIQSENLLPFAERVLSFPHLQLRGVMGVASLDHAPEIDFETIAKASAALQTLAPSARAISAGMSGDYEIAIGYGATHLRIGTAITGNRSY
jgi:pyridoxal phosphate enzyme (YggS family)